MSGSRRSRRTRSQAAASRASVPFATRVYIEAFAPQPFDERLGDRVFVFDNKDVHVRSLTALDESSVRT